MTKDLKNIPLKPGVYIFKDQRGNVLYVGKAKNLKNRLKSYFRKSAWLDERKAVMVKGIEDLSYIVTDNELEALVLEATLIKQHKPRFNVILRDDKNYPYLKLTVTEEWPRLEVVRRIKKDGSLYFGPYVPASSMWEALSFIRRNFLIRTCCYNLDKKLRPCLQFQMKRCPAPCGGHISREAYMNIVNEIRLFLQGRRKELIRGLETEMKLLSDEMRFEEAAGIRDRVNALKKAWESQKVISPELGDVDVIGFYRENLDAAFQIFFIRNGVMIGTKDFFLKDVQARSEEELFRSFITMFYMKEIVPPGEIIVGTLPEDYRAIAVWLGEKRGGRVRMTSPEKGKRFGLLQMADKNARAAFREKSGADTGAPLRLLKDRLGIAETPCSIGAFDVSTIFGSESVGAFVFWEQGEFRKDMYRHMKIKSVEGIDDYAMMEEIIERTISKIAYPGDEDKVQNRKIKMPDLVIIDGGKGQLGVAKKVMDKYPGLTKKKPVLVAVAKNPDRAFTLSSDDPVDLGDNSPASLLLRKIRDEAHRFAISFHRKLRAKRFVPSTAV